MADDRRTSEELALGQFCEALASCIESFELFGETETNEILAVVRIGKEARAWDGADADIFDQVITKRDVVWEIEGGNVAHHVIGTFRHMAAEADFFENADEMIAFGLIGGAEAGEIAIGHTERGDTCVLERSSSADG